MKCNVIKLFAENQLLMIVYAQNYQKIAGINIIIHVFYARNLRLVLYHH